jgi:ABC-type dipeptide/oligopeptide/nickel transport system permease component
MLSYTLRRLTSVIPVLFGVSVLVFLMVHLTPGDPVRLLLGEDAEPGDVERLRAAYGFDRPLPIQYLLWLQRALTGDFGISIRHQEPVLTLIAGHIGATVELAVASLLVAVALGIPLGVLAAVRRNGPVDLACLVVALIGVSMPNFWLGMVLLAYLAVDVDWLPIAGRGVPVLDALGELLRTGRPDALFDAFRFLLLPAIALGTAVMAVVMRLTRSNLVESMGEDYIRTARAKGVSEWNVVYRHALRNSLLAVVTIVGLSFGSLLGGAVVTETVFSWPGLGRLLVDAIRQRNFPVIQAGVLLVAFLFVIVNLLVDLSYAWLDPRIRYD